MKDKITEALAKLDPMTDEHWTKSGLPDVDAVSNLVGEKVTRTAIAEASQGFTRADALERATAPATATPAETPHPEPETPSPPPVEHDNHGAIDAAPADVSVEDLERQIERDQLRLDVKRLGLERDRLAGEIAELEKVVDGLRAAEEKGRAGLEKLNAEIAAYRGKAPIDRALGVRRNPNRPRFPMVKTP